MAGQGKSQERGGCAIVFAVLIVLAVVFWGLSSLGHLLGLTPTFSEATDRPEGWVSRHYRGVVVGYVLTVALIVLVAVLGWLALMASSDDPAQVERARPWLSRVGWVMAGLVVAIIALPVGKRPGVNTAGGEVGSAREGNVPRLIGLSAGEAQDRLRDLGIDADWAAAPTREQACRVVTQNPAEGGEVAEYGEVKLECVQPIPRVVGRPADDAAMRVSEAGFESRFTNEPADFDTSRCRVRQQLPIGTAPPDTEVRLGLRCRRPPPAPKPAPEPETPAVSDCDENYSGCVPPIEQGDADCADVSGPVRVIGADVHGLDRDGDGSACE